MGLHAAMRRASARALYMGTCLSSARIWFASCSCRAGGGGRGARGREEGGSPRSPHASPHTRARRGRPFEAEGAHAQPPRERLTPYLSRKAWSTTAEMSSSGLPMPRRAPTRPFGMLAAGGRAEHAGARRRGCGGRFGGRPRAGGARRGAAQGRAIAAAASGRASDAAAAAAAAPAAAAAAAAAAQGTPRARAQHSRRRRGSARQRRGPRRRLAAPQHASGQAHWPRRPDRRAPRAQRPVAPGGLLRLGEEGNCEGAVAVAAEARVKGGLA